MFGKVASEALGTSDIGRVIKPENYDQIEAKKYILDKEGETIHFLIKSKEDEYCFTNLAFIHLDGSGAISKKILLSRYPYRTHSISNVKMETAGWIDADVELKFHINNEKNSFDIKKEDLDQVQQLYKVLIKISDIQDKNRKLYEDAANSLQIASSAIPSIEKTESNPEEQFKQISQYAFTWMKSAKQNFMQEDFGEVFKTFVSND